VKREAPGLEHFVQQRVRKDILQRSAYKVLPSDGYIKLDAMESPYTWPDTFQREWLSTLREINLNRYPDSVGVELCEEIRAWCGLHDSASMLLGNGSDELIQMIIMTLGGPVLTPEPTFGMYRLIAEAIGSQFVGVPLTNDFLLDQKKMLSEIEKHDPSCIFLAYPNNPTGNLFDHTLIKKIIDRASGLVIIDEAYHPYSGQTFLTEILESEHVVVLRTFSKFGLAGLRLGFLVGPHRWLEEINKVRLPYNINSVTQASVRFALSKDAWFRKQTEKISMERNRLEDALRKYPDVRVYSSRTNFLLFRLLNEHSDKVFDSLTKQKILIKNMDGTHEALHDCLRVTVGTVEENQKFLEALSIALQG
jgi:histidinol-phosphate aminotransferase